TQFFKTSLNGIDLSNSNIDQIAVSLEDIKGAKINQMQAIDLMYLLGVKVVE
ncbi:pentapeptide repeat protein, partial [human gut metagenome]